VPGEDLERIAAHLVAELDHRDRLGRGEVLLRVTHRDELRVVDRRDPVLRRPAALELLERDAVLGEVGPPARGAERRRLGGRPGIFVTTATCGHGGRDQQGAEEGDPEHAQFRPRSRR
jgi:hypothetical protein